MATAKNTIKDWFKNGLKPVQEQFWAWIDSYWHKDEKIPIAAIDDIENILNAKADAEALTNHVDDANAHAVLFAKSKVYELGQMQVFKKKLPDEAGYLVEQQDGDYCIGFVYNDADEIEFISADFMGGDKTKKINYDV